MEQINISEKQPNSLPSEKVYQLKVFKSIQQISDVLGTIYDVPTVLKYILRECVETMGFNQSFLYLIDNQGKYLECWTTYGFSPREDVYAGFPKYNINSDDCIEIRVLKSGKPFYWTGQPFYGKRDDLNLDKNNKEEISQRISFNYVPLTVQDKTIGLLCASKTVNGETISSLEKNSLQIIANHAARVIENARLYQEIVKNRNFMEDVLRFMLNGVITTDVNGKVTSINNAACTILKIRQADVLGKKLTEILRQNEHVITDIEEQVNKEGFYHGYNVELKLDEEIRYFIINVSVIRREKGVNDGTIVILHDMTEKKYNDEYLQRVESLASLGRFAAGIAHEIRNPLTGISLFLDDLHDKIPGSQTITQSIASAITEIERLEKLVTTLLEYASTTSGELQEKSINNLIEDILMFINKECTSYKIKVKTYFEDKLPLLFIDVDKIRQAILNIFLNAIQAMSGGGVLEIRTEYLKIIKNLNHLFSEKEISSADGWVRMVVRDTGTGIDSNLKEKIFEPFFTTRRTGTGLGLSVTHNIIHEHNGKIFVDSEIGKGTRFTIYLPITERENV
jgi:PAS domain S-box-containing protein